MSEDCQRPILIKYASREMRSISVMNVANGTKVLLIDTFVNYLHVPSGGLSFDAEDFGSRPAGAGIVAGCKADEYTFDRWIV